jgi:hypothetical protein
LPRRHETDHALRLTDEGREIGRRKAEAQQAEPAQIRPDLRDPPRDMVACDASEGASVKIPKVDHIHVHGPTVAKSAGARRVHGSPQAH